MLKSCVFGVVFLGFAACASAQTQQYLVTWDDPNPSDKGVQGYRLTVDGGPPVTVPFTGTTPCTACANTTITVSVPASHVLSLVSYNAIGTSTPATTITIGGPAGSAPTSPTNISATPVGPSPDGTIVPPATSITDAANGIWTIEGNASCPANVPQAICQSVRLNHVQVAAGNAIKWVGGSIYAHGADVPTQHWWRRVGSSWVDTGTTEP